MAAEEKDVQEIDGGHLEGGGQVLRNAVSLCALLGRAVRVSSIRSKRAKPGLAAQHLTGLQLVQRLCDATLLNASIGSCEISIHPKRLLGGVFTGDTKTAGSVGLLFQIAFPCALYASGAVTLHLKGGTNADMAPQIDYTTNVLLPTLRRLCGGAIECSIEIIKRGYYPQGGGHVKVDVQPLKKALPALVMTDPGRLESIHIRCFTSGSIPVSVGNRMAEEALSLLRREYPEDSDVTITSIVVREKPANSVGNGTGVFIMATTSTGCLLAGSALGKRGRPAETVAGSAVEELLASLRRKVCADEYMQDQLIIFMALADGLSSIRCGTPSLHTLTAIHYVSLLTGVAFNISDESDGAHVISCNGIAFLPPQLKTA